VQQKEAPCKKKKKLPKLFGTLCKHNAILIANNVSFKFVLTYRYIEGFSFIYEYI